MGKTEFEEFVEFLAPNTRLDIRRQALGYALEISSALDGSASATYLKQQCLLGNAICALTCASVTDRGQCLAALTNFASGSPEVASHILSNEGIIQKVCAYHVANAPQAWECCKLDQPWATYGARLLANLSRHFPDKLQKALKAVDDNFENWIVSTSTSDSWAGFIAFVLLNLSQLEPFRVALASNPETLLRICTILRSATDAKRREAAAGILKNLCFEDKLHDTLLSSENAFFLAALLAPLADVSDELDDDEMSKLPLDLQFYEGSRERELSVRAALVEGLYQLCSTKKGRCTLREKGAYALLREFDKATQQELNETPESKKSLLLIEEENTLRALIGVLIRYEEELGISHDVESLRTLQ